MKPFKHTNMRSLAGAIGICAASISSLFGDVLYNCPEGDGGDFISRGFYVEEYIGQSLDKVKLHFRTTTAHSGEVCRITLTAREESYDGPIIGSASTTVKLGENSKETTFNFGNITAPAGKRVCFLMKATKPLLIPGPIIPVEPIFEPPVFKPINPGISPIIPIEPIDPLPIHPITPINPVLPPQPIDPLIPNLTLKNSTIQKASITQASLTIDPILRENFFIPDFGHLIPVPTLAHNIPIYYDVPTPSPTSGNCTNIIQTNGTEPALSTQRRIGVRVSIEGDRFLNVGPNQSIQLAIDNAAVGDTVHVSAGTYTEDISLRSNVSVAGDGFGKTILQGAGGNSVVTANSVTNSKFSGFSITGSNKDGVTIIGGSPFFENNEVGNNPDAGFYVWGGATPVLCQNIIHDNAEGIFIIDAEPLVTNNRSYSNHIGIYVTQHTSDGTKLHNNTVAENASFGIRCFTSSPSVKNNIVTGNGAGFTAAGTNAQPSFSYNCLALNTNSNLSDIAAQPWVGAGNIEADPLYVSHSSLADKLAIQAVSPCIDAGDPAAAFDDLDGTRNDMGWQGGPCGLSGGGSLPIEGFVFTTVGLIPTSEITAAGLADVDPSTASSLGITEWNDAAFGSTLNIHGGFAPSTNVDCYTIQTAPGINPPASAFTYVSSPLNKPFFMIDSSGVTPSTQSVGPNIIANVPYYQHTVNSSSGYWGYPDRLINLVSRNLPNGIHTIRLRGYDALKNPVTLSPNNDLVLHINNTAPTVSFSRPEFNGTVVDECATIILGSSTDTLNFDITATHPDGFLNNYSFVSTFGRNKSGGTIASDSYTTSDISVVDSPVAATPVLGNALPNLLPWKNCAYQFRLSAWSNITNGYNGRLFHRTFFDTYALRIGSGSADLDGDGDVDGDDLSLFIGQFGSTSTL